MAIQLKEKAASMTDPPELPFAETPPQHLVVTGARKWPTVRVWVRRQNGLLDVASLAPLRDARIEHALLPCEADGLVRLSRIGLGVSRASLYVAPLDSSAQDKRLVLCSRSTAGAVRVHGSVTNVRDTLFKKARTALLNIAAAHKGAGRSDVAAAWDALAASALVTQRAARQAAKGRSIRTMSGGLPSLGKRT